MNFAKGYRTYILAGLAVVTAVVTFVVGDADAQKTLEDIWKVLMPLALIALRAAAPKE